MKTSFRALVLASFSIVAFVACGGQADTSSGRSLEMSANDPSLADTIVGLADPAAPGVGTKATRPVGEGTAPISEDAGTTEIVVHWSCGEAKGDCNVTGIGSALDCKNTIVKNCKNTVTLSW